MIMTNAKHERLRRLFDGALELPTSARGAFIDAECGADAELKRRLAAMLAAAEDEQFLAAPTGPKPAAAESEASAPLREGPGTRIGPYKLLELIGEGGFGAVFLAEQEKPVARRVALKIIKLGMDTRQVVARFEQERQALALMDHPNIARVIDAGATDTGRPYFVMDLVKGDPIAQYCDKNQLTIDERLGLFAQVCNAVQHAHQKGIIHRDIKPSNILVSTQDGRPHAKVIDFGIAKATSSKLTDKTLFTEHQQIIGTLQYMSPEQAAGSLDIDTRTDVYSLGVLLYELLTGSTPFDKNTIKDAMFSEIHRMIREVEPPKPSTRLSQSADAIASIAAHRGVEPRRLGAIVRGELDWIVMKALEKDRVRRYETANGLAMDVRRYLSGEPVAAAPPSAAYRAKKFVSRNKGPVLAGSLLLLTLVGGIAGTSIGMVRAVRARADEQQQASRARTISGFMKNILNGAGPSVAKGRDGALLKDLMDTAAAQIAAGQLEHDPEAEADLRQTIGNVYRELGDLDAAEVNIRRAVVLAEAHFGRDDPRTHDIEVHLAVCLTSRGKYDEAYSIASRFVDACNRRGESESEQVAAALCVLGMADYNRSGGDLAAAEQAHQRALEIRRRVHPAGHVAIGRSLKLVAFDLCERHAFAEAEPVCREALDIHRRVEGPLHPNTIGIACTLGDILTGQQKYAEVDRLLRPVLADAETLVGPNHRWIADVLWRLGEALYRSGDAKSAEPLLARCLAIRKQVYSGPHRDVASALASVAANTMNLGDPVAAEPLFREVLDMRRSLFGAQSAVVASSLRDIGTCLSRMGRSAEASKAYSEAIDVLKLARPDSLELAHAQADYAVEKERLGEMDTAIGLYRDVLAFLTQRLGPDHVDVAEAMTNLGAALFRVGRKKEAEVMLVQAVEIYRKTGDKPQPKLVIVFGNLAFLFGDRGDYPAAERVLRELLDLQRKLVAPSHLSLASALVLLGDNLLKQGRFADAEPVVRECLAIREANEPNAWTTFNTTSMLGGSLLAQGKHAEAEPLLVAGHAGLKSRTDKIPPQFRKARLTEAVERLVKLYDATGKPEEATKWRTELEALEQKK